MTEFEEDTFLVAIAQYLKSKVQKYMTLVFPSGSYLLRNEKNAYFVTPVTVYY